MLIAIICNNNIDLISTIKEKMLPNPWYIIVCGLWAFVSIGINSISHFLLNFQESIISCLWRQRRYQALYCMQATDYTMASRFRASVTEQIIGKQLVITDLHGHNYHVSWCAPHRGFMKFLHLVDIITKVDNVFI